MRRVVNISASLLLCLWYIMATAGIDVHSDRHDSKTYVVSLLGGTSCESIHPEDECECCHTHQNGDGEDGINDFDCSNEIHILSFTGEEYHLSLVFPIAQTPACASAEEFVLPLSCTRIVNATAFNPPPRSVLNRLCVFRV